MNGLEVVIRDVTGVLKSQIDDAKVSIKKEVNRRFDERLESIHSEKQALIKQLSQQVECDFKREILNLSKKITMLVELQRKRFKDFEEMIAKSTVRVDALTKRDLKR